MRTLSATILLALLSVLDPLGALAQSVAQPEYEVKAAILVKVIRFVEWGTEAQRAQTLTVCVLGDDDVEIALGKYAGNRVQGRYLAVEHIENARAAGELCDVLYVGHEHVEQLANSGTVGARMLTVSDATEFATMGGMLEMRNDQNRIKFSINLDASDEAGISFGAQLLQLATIVRDSGGKR